MKKDSSWLDRARVGARRLLALFACGALGGLSAWALPEGYTPLDYIESTGAQRIDTNYTVVEDVTTAEFDFGHPDYENDTTFFGLNAWNGNCFLFIMQSNYFRFYGTNGYATGPAAPFVSTEDYHMSINDQNQFTIRIADGRVYSVANNRKLDKASVKTLSIFGVNGQNSKYRGKFRFYRLKLFENGVLKRDYVPCLNASNTPGIYDNVTGVFHGNSISGAAAFNYQVTQTWAAGQAKTATWGGAHDKEDFRLARNWMVRDVNGRHVNFATVPPDTVDVVDFASDADWRGFDPSTLAAYRKLDLKGHKLQLSLTAELAAFGEITDTVGGGVLELAVPEGVVHNNTSLKLSGLVKLVKVGKGALQMSRQWQSFMGGVVVREGTVKFGAQSVNCPLGGQGNNMIVESDGELDLNGQGNANDYLYILAGGRLVNNGANIGVGTSCIQRLVLTADSTVGGTGQFGLVGWGYIPTYLSLNGHTLNIEMTNPGSIFHITYCMADKGRIHLKRGTFYSYGANSTMNSLHDVDFIGDAGTTFRQAPNNGKNGHIYLKSVTSAGAVGKENWIYTDNYLFESDAPQTVDAALGELTTGKAKVVKRGSGQLSLGWDHPCYGGGLDVQAGSVKAIGKHCFGQNGMITMAPGTWLDINGQKGGYQAPATIIGDGDGNGAIQDTSSTPTDYGYGYPIVDLTLAGDASLGCPSSMAFIKNSYNAITWDLGEYTLTKKGAGELATASTTLNGAGEFIVQAGSVATVATTTFNVPVTFRADTRLDLNVKNSSKGAAFVFNRDVTFENGATMTGSSAGATLTFGATFVSRVDHIPVSKLILNEGARMVLPLGATAFTVSGGVEVAGAAELDVSNLFAYGDPQGNEVTVLQTGTGFALNGGPSLRVTGLGANWKVAVMDGRTVRLIREGTAETLPACVETATVSVNANTIYDFPASVGANLQPGVYDLAKWTTAATGYGAPTLRVEGCAYETELVCGICGVKLLVKSPAQSAAKPIRIWMAGDNRVNANIGWRIQLVQKLALAGWNVKTVGARSSNQSDPSGATVREAWRRHNGINGLGLKTSKNNAGFLEGLETYALTAEEPEFTVLYFSTWTYWESLSYRDGDQVFAFWKEAVDRILARFPNTTVIAVTMPTDTLDQNVADYATRIAARTGLNDGIRAVMAKSEAQGGFPAGRVVLCDLDRLLNPVKGVNWNNNWEYTTVGHEQIAEHLKTAFLTAADFNGRLGEAKLCRVRNSLDPVIKELKLLFNKPLASVPATVSLYETAYPEVVIPLSNFSLSEDGRTLTCQHDAPLTPGLSYTLMVNGVEDQAHLVSSQAQRLEFMPRALGLENNVPEAYTQGFVRLATLDMPLNYHYVQDTGKTPYTNERPLLPVSGIAKAGYYVEAIEKESGELTTMWFDFDAVSENYHDIMLPVTEALRKQKPVTKLHVWSNTRAVKCVAADNDAVNGFIEFNPINYSATAANPAGSTAGWLQANNSKNHVYDWNDTMSTGAGSGHGTFQFFRMFADGENGNLPAEALFTFNRWGADHTDCEGFGFGTFADYKTFNTSNWTLDRTFCYGAPGSEMGAISSPAYSLRRIEFYAKLAGEETLEQSVDGEWTGATNLVFATAGNWEKNGTPLTTLTSKTVRVPASTTQVAFSYATSDPTVLSSTTLLMDGPVVLNGVGAFYLRTLNMGSTGRLVFDPTKTTLRFATAPRFAAGAKIVLAAPYANATKGRFLLCTFDRGTVAGPANLADIIHISAAEGGVVPTVWTETLEDGSGRLWLDLNAETSPLKSIRVMCVGDSITHGSDSNYGNWRIPLMKKLNAMGFDPTATGFRCDQSHDEAGATMPERWIWHSGVGGRRLITGNGGGVQDALETEIDQAGDVDVLLLKIGTNDINSDNTTAETLFTAWTNTVLRMLTQSPCKVIAGAVVHINNTAKNEQVMAFNAMVRAAIEEGRIFPANRVYFADLYTACPRFDEGGEFIPGSFQNANDLHPDWYGEDLVAEEYARVIQIALANGTPLPQTEPTTSGCENNVPADYRAGFKLARVYNALQLVDLTNAAAEIPYEDFSANLGATQNLARVGYYIELKRKNTAITDYRGRVRWLWVDVTAFGDRDIETCGLPLRKWAQQSVGALHVISNMPGIEKIPADDDSQTGFVEFWPYNYNSGASGVPGAPANKYKYDWNDVRDTSGNYGSMQVHRVLPAGSRNPAQVLFAFNSWRSATADRCIGLGTFAWHDTSIDWTHVYDENSKTLSSAAYDVGRIEIWTIGMDELPAVEDVWRPANATTTNIAESVAAWQRVGEPASALHGFQNGASILFDGQDRGSVTCNVPVSVVARSVNVTGTKNYAFMGPGQIVADRVTFAPEDAVKLTVMSGGFASDDICIQRGTVKLDDGLGLHPFGSGTAGRITIAEGGQLEYYYRYSGNMNANFCSAAYDKEIHIAGDGPDGRGALVGSGTGGNGSWYGAFGRVVLDSNASIGGDKRIDFRAAWANRRYTGRPTLTGPGKIFTSRNTAPESYDLGLDFNNADLNVGKIVVAENANLGFEGTCTVTTDEGIELKNGSRLEFWGATVSGTGTIYIRSGVTAKISGRSGTSYLRLPVVVEEGGTLILGGTATMRFEAGLENHGGTIRQESSGSHYFLNDQTNEDNPWNGKLSGTGQFVFGDPTSGHVPLFPLLDLTGEGTGNIWFRISEDQTIKGDTYRLNAPNATVFMDALNTAVTIDAVPQLTVKDANWNFGALKMGSSANPGSLVIDGGELTCKTLTTVGGTDWRSGRIELKNGGKLTVTAANHGVESCAAQIASTTSTGNALENVIEVGDGCELAVPNGYFFNGWSGRYARVEINEGATATLYGINGRRRYNGVNGTTKHDSIFRMNGGTLNLGPGGFLHGYTAYAGSAQSNEVLKDHYAESGSLFRLNAGTLVATANTVSDKNQNSEGVDIVFGESRTKAGDFTIDPNGYNFNLRGGIKGWSDVTVKGSGSLVTDPHVKGFALGKWRIEAGVDAKLDGAAGFMGGLDLAPNATARVNALSTGLVEFLCGSFTWVGLTNETYMTRYTYFADDLYYAQRTTHSNGPNYQAFAYRGEFYVPADKANTWWFFGQWDDVVVVQIDGKVVVNGGGTASRGSIALTEGWHRFVVYVNDGYGGKGPNSIGVGFRVGSDGGTTAGNYTAFNTTALEMRPARLVNWYSKNVGANYMVETANLANLFDFNLQDYDWLRPTNSVKMCNSMETAFKDTYFKTHRNLVKGWFWVDPAEAGTWAFRCGYDDYSGLKIDGHIVVGTTTWTQPSGGSWEATPGLHEFEMLFGDTSGGYGVNAYSGLAGKAMIAVSVNGAEFVPFDEDYFGIGEAKHVGLAGTSTLAKGSRLTNAGSAPYPIIGTVFGGGTLDGAFRFEGGWIGVTGAGANYESVKFANAAADTFKGLGGVVCDFSGLPGRGSYCLGDAMGITDAEARQLPVLVGVSNGGNYNYSSHASSMHCEVIGGKLYLVDPIPMNSVIFFR